MRKSYAGRALLGLGLAIGIAAPIAWLLGYDPSTLPPEVLRIAAYKLTAIAAFGLMSAGAVVLRYSRNADERATLRKATSDSLPLPAGDAESVADRFSRDQSANRPDPVSERRS